MTDVKLKFSEKLCATCPTYDCLVKCQYMEIDRKTAQEEILKIIKEEDSFVLHECTTCYACEEYCKRGNHPFYLIADLHEKKGILVSPKPLTRQWINMTIPSKRDFPQFYGASEPAISLCVFPDYIRDIGTASLI